MSLFTNTVQSLHSQKPVGKQSVDNTNSRSDIGQTQHKLVISMILSGGLSVFSFILVVLLVGVGSCDLLR